MHPDDFFECNVVYKYSIITYTGKYFAAAVHNVQIFSPSLCIMYKNYT